MAHKGRLGRLLEFRTVAGQVVHREDSSHPLHPVHDGPSDLALIEGAAGRPQAVKPRPAGGVLGLDHLLQGIAQRHLDEHGPGTGEVSVGEEYRGAARWALVELLPGGQRIQALDQVLVEGNPMLGVVDRRGQHLSDGPGAVPFQKGYEGVDDPGDGNGQVGLVPGSGGYGVVAQRPVVVDGGRGRRNALPAQRQQVAASGVVEHEHALGSQGV